jgi:hypothetical protein
MKTIAFVFGLLLFSSYTLLAQPGGKAHPITQETFKVKLKVEKNRAFSILSFVSSKGMKRKAKITRAGKLTHLKLKPGTIIEGTYRFSTFSSDGGLGGTRIVKGEGKGNLKVSNIIVTEVDPMVSGLAGVGDMAVRLY